MSKRKAETEIEDDAEEANKKQKTDKTPSSRPRRAAATKKVDYTESTEDEGDDEVRAGATTLQNDHRLFAGDAHAGQGRG